MLSHCANSQCSTQFLRLGQGKLFLVEAESRPEELAAPIPRRVRRQLRRVERYWLCDQCGEIWTLVQDRIHGITLLPLPSPPSPRSVEMVSK